MLYYLALFMALVANVYGFHQGYLPQCTAGGVEYFVDTVEKCANLTSIIAPEDCNDANNQAVIATVQNCLPKTVYNPSINLDLTVVYRNSSYPTLDRRLYQYEVVCALVKGTPSAGVIPAAPAVVVWDFITGSDLTAPGAPDVGYFPVDASFHKVCHTYSDAGTHPVAIFAVDTDGRSSQLEATIEIRDALII